MSLSQAVGTGALCKRDSGDREAVLRLDFMWSFLAVKAHLEPSVFNDLTEEGGTWVLSLTIGKEF